MDFTFNESDPWNDSDDNGNAIIKVHLIEGDGSLDAYVDAVKKSNGVTGTTLPSDGYTSEMHEFEVRIKILDIFRSEIKVNNISKNENKVVFDIGFKPMINAFKSDLMSVLEKLNKITFQDNNI